MSAEWDYEEHGPTNWLKVYPVANGHRQSPIDIVTKSCEYCETLKPLKVDYKQQPNMELSNNGHTVTAKIQEGSVISGGPLEGKYSLAQFHFHWGSSSNHGSEHTIDGQEYAAELHLVHWNSTKYETFNDAVDKSDGLAVFGVMIKIGDTSNEFTPIANVLDKVIQKDSTFKMKDSFNPESLLGKKDKYWTYLGSLTTPPLYESVTWILFKDPLVISESQIQCFRELRTGHASKPELVDNYRPPCPLHNRPVRASFK